MMQDLQNNFTSSGWWDVDCNRSRLHCSLNNIQLCAPVCTATSPDHA